MERSTYWVMGYCTVLLATLLAARLCSRAVTVMAETDAVERKHTIVIDAGHGGVDGGATSCTGVLEKEINLQISLRLEKLLNLLGHKTRMIRREDVSVYTKGDTIAQKKASDLQQRLKVTDQEKAPVLVSIHQNQFHDSRYSGAQVFYADDPDSKTLAAALQRNFVTILNPGSHRQEKKSSGVYLMDRVRCPAVLIECGFLSNPEEEARLLDAGYQKKLCSIIAATLSESISNT